jgi:hypothetical protein
METVRFCFPIRRIYRYTYGVICITHPARFSSRPVALARQVPAGMRYATAKCRPLFLRTRLPSQNPSRSPELCASDRNRRKTIGTPRYRDDGIQEDRTVCHSGDGTDV